MRVRYAIETKYRYVAERYDIIFSIKIYRKMLNKYLMENNGHA